MAIRIITEENPQGRWTAWFDGKLAGASQGENAAHAVRHLVEFSGCDDSALLADFKRCTDTHQEFILDGILCPECLGSGRYIGLTRIEDCNNCGGSGVLSGDREEGVD